MLSCVSDGCKFRPALRLTASVGGPAHALGRTLRFLVAPVRSGFSLDSRLLARGETFSRATALVARNRGFLISPSQCGSRQSSQWRTPRFSGPNRVRIPLVSRDWSQMPSSAAGAGPLLRVWHLDL